MHIREAKDEDFDQIWEIFSEIVSSGATYAIPPEISKTKAKELWMREPRKTFVAEIDDDIVGTYYIKTNQEGPGNHVCNCGYMVPKNQRGKGIATEMCKHSQVIARDMGYQAMQFNFVASNNTKAVNLWKKSGFDIVGRLPKAFDHPEEGLIDALVMYKWLV